VANHGAAVEVGPNAAEGWGMEPKQELAAKWAKRADRLESDAEKEPAVAGQTAMKYGAQIYRNCALELLGDKPPESLLGLVLENLQNDGESE